MKTSQLISILMWKTSVDGSVMVSDENKEGNVTKINLLFSLLSRVSCSQFTNYDNVFKMWLGVTLSLQL